MECIIKNVYSVDETAQLKQITVHASSRIIPSLLDTLQPIRIHDKYLDPSKVIMCSAPLAGLITSLWRNCWWYFTWTESPQTFSFLRVFPFSLRDQIHCWDRKNRINEKHLMKVFYKHNLYFQRSSRAVILKVWIVARRLVCAFPCTSAGLHSFSPAPPCTFGCRKNTSRGLPPRPAPGAPPSGCLHLDPEPEPRTVHKSLLCLSRCWHETFGIRREVCV